jgi:hypothetical protein
MEPRGIERNQSGIFGAENAVVKPIFVRIFVQPIRTPSIEK